MKTSVITPFILGMVLALPSFSQVNVVSAVTPTQTVQLTKEVLSSRTLVALDVNNKYLRLIDKLLIAVEAEGLQRDWFVNDLIASQLNSFHQTGRDTELRNLSLQIANKILTALNQGYVKPEMLGNKTLRRLYEFKRYTNSKLSSSFPKGTSDDVIENALAEDFKKVTVNSIYSELVKAENTNVESEDLVISQLIEKFRPKNLNYQKLLAMYKTILEKQNSGEINDSEIPKRFVTILPNEVAQAKGRKNDRLSILFARKRLQLFGYANDVSNPEYTEDLRTAIKDLQNNNLLIEDGILGPQTFEILSTKIEQILTRLKINLDRSRWLADDLKSEYVHVNLAAQRLFYYKNGQIALSFKTINGAKDRPTPILSSRITHMILNPTWTVAPTSYFKDKTETFSKPSGLKDVQLKRYTFKVFSRSIIDAHDRAYKLKFGPQAEHPFLTMMKTNTDANGLIKADETTWGAFMMLFADEGKRLLVPGATPSKLTPALMIIQRPGGDENALGWIKFPLNDTNSIYMHDTNQRELFKENDRLKSSGCVRMEKPWDLALMLLGGSVDPTTKEVLDPADGHITRQALYDRTMNRISPETGIHEPALVPDPVLRLKQSVPVYMLYDTAQIDDHGQMTLVKDFYGVDMDMYNLMTGNIVAQ